MPQVRRGAGRVAVLIDPRVWREEVEPTRAPNVAPARTVAEAMLVLLDRDLLNTIV